jgi:hypothetical protein
MVILPLQESTLGVWATYMLFDDLAIAKQWADYKQGILLMDVSYDSETEAELQHFVTVDKDNRFSRHTAIKAVRTHYKAYVKRIWPDAVINVRYCTIKQFGKVSCLVDAYKSLIVSCLATNSI